MSEFKVGDRVKLVHYIPKLGSIGDMGTVIDVDPCDYPFPIAVKADKVDPTVNVQRVVMCSDDEVVKIEEQNG